MVGTVKASPAPRVELYPRDDEPARLDRDNAKPAQLAPEAERRIRLQIASCFETLSIVIRHCNGARNDVRGATVRVGAPPPRCWPQAIFSTRTRFS